MSLGFVEGLLRAKGWLGVVEDIEASLRIVEGR